MYFTNEFRSLSLLAQLPSNNRLERIWKLSQVDFLSRYYNDKLGLIWALLTPIFQASVYYVVFSYFLDKKEENYGLFIFCGIVLWMAFTESTSRSMTILKRKNYLISNIQFFWVDLYISHVISVFLALLFNFGSFILICLCFEIFPSLLSINLILVFITLFLFCFGVSLILSVIQPFIVDLNHLWDMMLLIGFWSTGIFFPMDKIIVQYPVLGYVNPLIGIVHNARACILPNIDVNSTWMLSNFLTAISITGIGLVVFYKYVHSAVEKI